MLLLVPPPAPGRMHPHPMPAWYKTATGLCLLAINKSPCKVEPISLSLGTVPTESNPILFGK